MYQTIRRISIWIILGLSLFFTRAVSAGSGIPEPYPLPGLTGSLREDLLAVADSQLGYSEAEDGSNYFAWWYDPSDPTADWCTEFFIWCAEQAHVPVSVIPKAGGVHSLQGFFLSRGRFYFLEGGITESLAGMTGIRTLSIEDARPGDILLTESHNNPENGPDHVAVFLSYSDGLVKTISGNCGNRVAINYHPVSGIHGICRPAYDGASLTIKRKYTCILPDTVTAVPDLNFRDIENLYDFTMGNQVVSVGRSAFYGCVNMKMHCDLLTLRELGQSAFSRASAPKTVVLKMRTVPRSAFYQARDLETAAFSTDKTLTIEYSAFCRAPDLKALIFSAGITDIVIGEYAFSRCPVETVEIPPSVQRIQGEFPASAALVVEKGSYAEKFASQHGYKTRYSAQTGIVPGEPSEVTVNGGVYKVYPDKNQAVFCRPTDKKAANLTIRDTVRLNGKTYRVTSVENGACKGLKELKTLVIGKNIESIGRDAFRNCKKLKTITIKTKKLTKEKTGKNAFRSISGKPAVKCPEKLLDAYREYLLSAGIPENTVFRAK